MEITEFRQIQNYRIHMGKKAPLDLEPQKFSTINLAIVDLTKLYEKYYYSELGQDLEAVTRTLIKIKMRILDMCAEIGLDFDALRWDLMRVEWEAAIDDIRVRAQIDSDDVMMGTVLGQLCVAMAEHVKLRHFVEMCEDVAKIGAYCDVFAQVYLVDMAAAFNVVMANFYEMTLPTEEAAMSHLCDAILRDFSCICHKSPAANMWIIYNAATHNIIPPAHWQQAYLDDLCCKT